MSEWNHPVCDDCWKERQGARAPARVIEPKTERCCQCRKPTRSGIYVRGNPTHPSFKCNGVHGEASA